MLLLRPWTLLPFVASTLASTAIEHDYHPDPDRFDDGDLGAYPVQGYASSSLTPPFIVQRSGSPPRDDGMHIFFSPRGLQVNRGGPMILDETGEPVWISHEFGIVYSFTSQEIDGERFLTFWSGNDAVKGHGAGEYVVLNSKYQEVRRLNAGNGLKGDLHEFKFTDNGTYLVTAYTKTEADLSVIGGPEHGWIWDSVVQEIDFMTDEVIFEWRASEHLSVADSYKVRRGDGNHESPYDFYHINSIDKDDVGNYMICSRYFHTVMYINATDGEPIWIMGGKQNMFEDLSDGRATNFAWQHDARWHENHTHISLFDNREEIGRVLHHSAEKRKDSSRGMYLRVDPDRFQVELIHEYVNPLHLISSSQGSMQVLPNNRVLLGYGYTPAWTEFDMQGNVLWDVHFGAEAEFESGAAQSFRVLKRPWVGHPIEPPSFVIQSDKAYVSWNGATEVTSWTFETSGDDVKYHPIATMLKTGFETSFSLDGHAARRDRYLRVSAIDKHGKVLGTSRSIDTRPPAIPKPPTAGDHLHGHHLSPQALAEEAGSSLDNQYTLEGTKSQSQSHEPVHHHATMTTLPYPTSLPLSLGLLVPFLLGLWVLSVLVGAMLQRGGTFVRGRFFYRPASHRHGFGDYNLLQKRKTELLA